ncbi:zein-binding domain-containing protein [Artemisia annua]|uniref:Zein-binding domain-containing protein n=1 Tax=Artemisia annua TaxID=35608 RepID=A0A2U1QBU5_ARTAN|nr:zein-binding domain-containing protein [Artemisia annua]
MGLSEEEPCYIEDLREMVQGFDNLNHHPRVLNQSLKKGLIVQSLTRTLYLIGGGSDHHLHLPKEVFVEDIEQRINELERSPRQQPVLEKVVVGHAPRTQQLTSRFSLDSGSSIFATIKEDNSSVKKVDSASEYESEMSDRIYTVDSIHYGASYQNDPKANVNTNDDFMNSPKDSMHHSHNDVQDPEVLKLYARLHALEADRESMRQAIINMRTDKAQLVLLKEIAQNLCKGMSPASRMPVKKQSVFWTFGHSVASFMLWRRKANHTKYMLGMTASDAGLLVLLGRGSQMGQWRYSKRMWLWGKEERLRLDQEKTKKMLEERRLILETKTNEINQKIETQKVLQTEADLLFRFRSLCNRIRPLREKEEQHMNLHIQKDEKAKSGDEMEKEC